MKLSFGYSPCPNDTYMFSPIANGTIGIGGDCITPILRDVDTLNFMALDKILDISKLSFYAYFKVKKTYELLSNAAAIGFNCGPVLIARKMFNRRQIRKCRIMFPGELTTAHLLFRLWEPGAEQRFFTSYDKIFDSINNNEADCGVVIHESRFTYEKLGFKLLIDLGSWWEKTTGLPVPLGCIVARKAMGRKRLSNVNNMLKLSLKEANSNPVMTLPYVKKFAQELSDDVLLRHICTFVNEFSLGFGDVGLAAIDKLYSKAHDAGIIK